MKKVRVNVLARINRYLGRRPMEELTSVSRYGRLLDWFRTASRKEQHRILKFIKWNYMMFAFDRGMAICYADFLYAAYQTCGTRPDERLQYAKEVERIEGIEPAYKAWAYLELQKVTNDADKKRRYHVNILICWYQSKESEDITACLGASYADLCQCTNYNGRVKLLWYFAEWIYANHITIPSVVGFCNLCINNFVQSGINAAEIFDTPAAQEALEALFPNCYARYIRAYTTRANTQIVNMN